MVGKKEKEKSVPSSPSKDDAPVRKSTRIKQNSKFEERMRMFIMQSKRGTSDEDEEESTDEEDKIEIKKSREEPKRIIEKSSEKEPSSKESGSDEGAESEKEEGEVKKEIEQPEEEKSEPEDEPPKKKAKKPEGTSKSGKKLGRPRKRPPTPPEPSHSDEDPDSSHEDKDFNPGMLNLRRVGDAVPTKKGGVSLNARGMPQRIRKKNKLFYEDNVVSIPGKKDKTKKMTPSEKKLRKIKDKKDEEIKQIKESLSNDSTEGNLMRQRIGMKLRNLLKLPKAQRWVYFEYFYSNIDHVLFHGTNDFVLCLDETFGHLRTMKMTRAEWSVVRRLMGKPRRCSQSFFREERTTLERRRDVIRLIQQRKIKDASQIKDLPDRIPLQLSVNARVTAKLRFPQTGLFTGKVDAVDPSNNTYRITFDRPNLGTHSIPDYEVLLSGEPDMVSLSSMQKRYQTARHNAPPKLFTRPQHPYMVPDTKDPRQIWMENMNKATFPIKFYETMIRICKILKEKKQIVESLKAMNSEAEKMVLWEDPYPLFFQKRYAELLVNLEGLNLSLNRRLNVVQKFCHDVAPEVCESVMLAPTYVREKNIADAKATMKAYFMHKEPLKSQHNTLLVVELMALVLQLQNLTRPKPSSQDRFVLKQTLQRVKSMISPENLLQFQNSVEVHVKYIETRFSENNHLAPLLVGSASNTTADKDK